MWSKVRRTVRNRLGRRLGIPEILPALQRLRTNGFVPQQIFDVGAYRGEFAKLCRSVWPNAGLTCFEVLPHRVQELRSWCTRDGNAVVIESLLGGESKGAVPFHEMETASSVLEEHIPQVEAVKSYPMRTIDEVVKSSETALPSLLKLDVQGYELEVLKGAANTLPHISAILTEVNLIDIHKRAPLLDELVLFLGGKGFMTYDICGFTRRPLDQALWQADFVFIPRESALRTDKRWRA